MDAPDDVNLGDWTVLTFRDAVTNKPLFIQARTREIPASTRDALRDNKAWVEARTSHEPAGPTDLLFHGSVANLAAAHESGRVTVEIVAGFDEEEALKQVTNVSRRHKCGGWWPTPRPRPEPRRRATSSSPRVTKRPRTTAASAPADATPAAPPPPAPEPCTACGMYPGRRAMDRGECDQCGAALG